MLDHVVKSSQNIFTLINTESAYILNFPYIEIVKFTGGDSAVIRGTRIKVSHIIGYLELGETPETITQNILPHLTLAQIHDAQKYYLYHQDEIDEERRENTEEAGRKYLLEKLGADKHRAATGG
jgi:uncharacterized protein (DUF433 family)